MTTLTTEMRSAAVWLKNGAEELENMRRDLRSLLAVTTADVVLDPRIKERYNSDFTERQMKAQAEKIEMILVGMDAVRQELR